MAQIQVQDPIESALLICVKELKEWKKKKECKGVWHDFPDEYCVYLIKQLYIIHFSPAWSSGFIILFCWYG